MHTPSSWRLCILVLLMFAGLGSQTLAVAQKGDPSRVRFTVYFDGAPVPGVAEVSGLGVEIEVVEVREGTTNEVRKVPGARRFSNLMLKRGVTGNTQFFDWAMSSKGGKIVRRAVTVSLTSQSGAAIGTWTCAQAFPAKWEGPALKATGNDLAFETLEIVCDTIAWSAAP
jgi:phage tail-like protein